MTRLAALLTAVVLAFSGAAGAQSVARYHYVAKGTAPAEVLFRPGAAELLCAGLLNRSGGGAVGLDTRGLRASLSCPAGPPVVVWGENSLGNGRIYAINRIKIRFYGPGTYDGAYGIDALLPVLKRDYYLRLLAAGDLEKAELQYLPPVVQPPVNAPVSDGPGWRTWSGEERLAIDDPLIIRKKNHGRAHEICKKVYGANCWGADFIWALPVRLALRGDETGSPTITVKLPLYPERAFVDRATGRVAALGVSGGELVEIRLIPIEDGEP